MKDTWFLERALLAFWFFSNHLRWFPLKFFLRDSRRHASRKSIVVVGQLLIVVLFSMLKSKFALCQNYLHQPSRILSLGRSTEGAENPTNAVQSHTQSRFRESICGRATVYATNVSNPVHLLIWRVRFLHYLLFSHRRRKMLSITKPSQKLANGEDGTKWYVGQPGRAARLFGLTI